MKLKVCISIVEHGIIFNINGMENEWLNVDSGVR